MPAITPFLWFNDNAEEAANFNADGWRTSQRVMKAMQHAANEFVETKLS